MHHHRKLNGVLYDIGSEEGDLSALFASWGYRVVLVEPNPKVWPNIRAIFEANRLCPLDWWVGFAAAGGEPMPTVRPEPAWPECADGPVIHDHGFLTLYERPDVPRTTIDLMAERIEPPSAITIDVEGAELRVLKGAEHVLQTHRPKVWVSVHPDFMPAYGDTADELYAYMADMGYRRTFLATDHEWHEMFLPVETPW